MSSRPCYCMIVYSVSRQPIHFSIYGTYVKSSCCYFSRATVMPSNNNNNITGNIGYMRVFLWLVKICVTVWIIATIKRTQFGGGDDRYAA